MAALTWASRALRVDRGTWMWLESEATPLGATGVAAGTYVMFALDRFGWPDDALRASARFTLVGVYGWLGLSLAAWVIGRFVGRHRVRFATTVRLFGHAHVPLLLVAGTIQVFAVNLDITGMWAWPALVAGLVWMPAMLVRAMSAGTDVGLREAALMVALPYAMWAAFVGLPVWRQIAHLL